MVTIIIIIIIIILLLLLHVKSYDYNNDITTTLEWGLDMFNNETHYRSTNIWRPV